MCANEIGVMRHQPVWQAIFAAYPSGPGGVNAVLKDGTHNSEAWGEDDEGNTLPSEEAQYVDFGEYQEVTELWWRLHLNDNTRSESRLMRLLSQDPWNQEDCCPTDSTLNFELY